MTWLIVLVVFLGSTAFSIWWQNSRKLKRKRVLRQVRVDNIARVKKHKVGFIEILAEESLLVEFTYNDKSQSCQTVYNNTLYNLFKNGEPCFIFIDPENPSQCYFDVLQQSRFTIIWLCLSAILLICLVVLMLI